MCISAQAPAWLFAADYGPFQSAGDLGDRFGGGFQLGGSVSYRPQNSRADYGLLFRYGFGNRVKEDVLAGLRTPEGFVIGNQRAPAAVELRQRQLFAGAVMRYGSPLGSGEFLLASGLGYLTHRIRIQDDPQQFIPQLDEPLRAGYDRMAGGPAVYQFVGYRRLRQGSGLNFYVGVEAILGFTRQLRAFDVPSGMPPPDELRTDLVPALVAGIVLPIFGGEGRERFY